MSKTECDLNVRCHLKMCNGEWEGGREEWWDGEGRWGCSSKMGGCIHLGSSPYSSNRSHKGRKSHTRSIHKHAGRNRKEGKSPMSILKKAQHADKPDGTYCVWSDPEKNSCCSSLQADAFKGACYKRTKLSGWEWVNVTGQAKPMKL